MAIHVFGSLRPSGMERMMSASAQYWAQSGWRVIVVGQGPDHPYRRDLEDAGFEVFTIDELRSLRNLTRWARLVRGSRPDVVHIHVEGMHGPIALAARLAAPRARLIRTVHSVFRFQGRIRVTRTLQTIAFILVGGESVAPSPDVALNETEYWGFKSTVIENWVADDFLSDDAQSDRESGSGTTIALVGNCSAIKNHAAVLRAVADLNGFRVVHVGSESDMPEDERCLAHDLCAKGSMLRLGPRTDVKSILAVSDVYAMPSLHEGMGVSLAEALCVGTPALISDASGFSWARELPGVRVVPDGEWGAVLRDLRDPISLSRLRKAAYAGRTAVRERLRADRGVREYVALYSRTKAWPRDALSQIWWSRVFRMRMAK